METQVVVRLLPDGTGRVCIHWLYENPDGKIETIDNVINTSLGPKVLHGRKWTMACNPELSNISPLTEGAYRVIPWVHTDDARAATCPRCLASPEYKKKLEELAEILAVK